MTWQVTRVARSFINFPFKIMTSSFQRFKVTSGSKPLLTTGKSLTAYAHRGQRRSSTTATRIGKSVANQSGRGTCLSRKTSTKVSR